MLWRWFGPWIRWLILRYIERLVCLHFCKFKEAGSDFGYTHVHVLGNNPGGATGLGHDDHTNVDDPGHVTVSQDGTVEIGAETDATLGLRKVRYLTTAHFHEMRGDACPEGFRRIRCRCGKGEEAREFSVCYTTDQDVFEGWRLGNNWTNRVGTHPHPYTDARLITDSEPGSIACGSKLAIFGYASDRVGDCAGFGGAGDGENRVVVQARRTANEAAAKVACDGSCARTVTEVFRGWECESGFARACVIVVVSCARR